MVNYNGEFDVCSRVELVGRKWVKIFIMGFVIVNRRLYSFLFKWRFGEIECFLK